MSTIWWWLKDWATLQYMLTYRLLNQSTFCKLHLILKTLKCNGSSDQYASSFLIVALELHGNAMCPTWLNFSEFTNKPEESFMHLTLKWTSIMNLFDFNKQSNTLLAPSHVIYFLFLHSALSFNQAYNLIIFVSSHFFFFITLPFIFWLIRQIVLLV